MINQVWLLLLIETYIWMEFDILNELLTSTVYDLFTTSESAVYESKLKVK